MAILSEDKITLYKYWLGTIMLEASEKLNSWEYNFIGSLTEQLDNKFWISEKQAEILERIYASYTK
jgi:hypothetical protein